MNSELITTDQTYSPSCMSISPQQPTSVSELVVDERSNHFHSRTNRGIDDMITSQAPSRRSPISSNQFDIPIGEPRPWTEDSVFNYVFAANRDEQPDDRIAYPSDAVENILINLLSPAVIHLIFEFIWNNIPLGIQDTQPHTLVLLVLVNTSRRDSIISNENGDINEDGTVFNDTSDFMNDENMNSTTNMTERGNQMIVRESMGTETMDELTNNGNATVSTDVQDNNCLDNNNRDERVMEYVNTSEIDHQNNLNNDNHARGQVSPRPEHADNNGIHDHIESSMPTALILTSSVPRTSTIESSEQAEEIETLLAGPADNNNHTTEDPAHLLAAGLDVLQLNAHNRKQASPLNTSEKAGEEEIVQ